MQISSDSRMLKMHSILFWMFTIFLLVRGNTQNPKAEVTLEEEFTEDLLLRPLPDGKVLSHFHFIHKLPQARSYGGHHSLFPKAIFQLVKKFHVKEMELSFTQGRWNYQRWGGFDAIAAFNAKPVGVELWALFDVPKAEVDATWGNLTHALSGLFCASINFLESSTSVAEPSFSFKLDEHWIEGNDTCDSNLGTEKSMNCKQKKHFKEWQNAASITFTEGGKISRGTLSSNRQLGQLRYGALPREAVCTENLTPWLKLLPCRDKSGLTTLLDRSIVYNGFYHSLRLNIKSGQLAEGGILLRQSLTLVLLPSRQERNQKQGSSVHHAVQPQNWSLFSLFGKRLASGCPLAKSSHVSVELVGGFIEQLKEVDQSTIVVEETHLNEQTQSLERNPEYSVDAGSNIGVDPDLQTFESKSMPEVFLPAGEIQTETSLIESDGKLSLGNGLELDLRSNKLFSLSPMPGRILREVKELLPHYGSSKKSSFILEYELQMNKSFPFDVGLSWRINKPLKWSPIRAPFRISRFLVGSGNARGTITTIFKANLAQNFISATSIHENLCRSLQARLLHKKESLQGKDVEIRDESCSAIKDDDAVEGIDVIIFQIVPWYVRMYWHTLTFVLDGNLVPFWNLATVMRLVPAKDRQSPAMMELGIQIPANTGFLHIDEHPPDANRGFDIPAAIVSFPGYYSKVQYEYMHNTTLGPFIPSFLQTEKKPMPVYTEILLMQLATPDFSMPYNVITLTCTVLALYFGSLLNVLRRRIGEEERRSTKLGDSTKAGKLKLIISRYLGKTGDKMYSNLTSPKVSKLSRIFIVVIVAVAAHYMLNLGK
ncbi:hypothetical protein O6H91_06G132200 [Diphasiastrum complanatum]|uniref:Uncharacterized protein n=1 Tax=Diphasiastrum complanatum TaxID=34168 RepID=A0ACC2DIV1_DIPCM|nr:hypothetical protein O6H91_06G132200 [Diphasiastrum complanatum]